VLTAAIAVTLFVAVAHVGFFYLEAILWAKPAGRRIFGMKVEEAEATKVMAINQGFYNAGVAALLAWAALAPNPPAVVALLGFVVAMGVVGAVTAKGTILFLQAAPAALALVLWLLV